ncbi:uncharacterized protein LOC116291626 isoform X2 [Actinia tenebrosa]|uniref:Uncharacterized protein LOC116291626 isoform X2 n=1 Tax=Actinia tenebrosa TaxID=6105 RepID=A0A6P8HPV6_ACTTE|nr:uncharacterized protein LOC116291626 isoform X2 [Actinia tenebrosa]
MKNQLVFVFILFLLKHKVTYATMWPTQGHSELNVYMRGFTLESSKVETIFECYRKCEENIQCASINMNLTNKTCELKYSTKTRHPEKIVSQQNTIYMEIRDALGFSPHNPILSCKWFKNIENQLKSGVYWMKFNETYSAPFQVFCDMTTDGGGWTLVYSYTFTQYSAFNSTANAVTPIPNWPVDTSTGTSVPQSTTTPLGESSYSAMDFSLWKKIGNEILLKPNITNWTACVEGTGSLVNWMEGSVTCRVVKAITPTCATVVPTCATVVPTLFKFHICGPFFDLDSNFYVFLEGKTDSCFPAHDPCATAPWLNHLTNVTNPGGAIYIR